MLNRKGGLRPSLVSRVQTLGLTWQKGNRLPHATLQPLHMRHDAGPPPPNKWVLKIFIDEWIFDTGSLYITLNSQSACFCLPTAGLKVWVTKSNLKVFIYLKNKN